MSIRERLGAIGSKEMYAIAILFFVLWELARLIGVPRYLNYGAYVLEMLLAVRLLFVVDLRKNWWLLITLAGIVWVCVTLAYRSVDLLRESTVLLCRTTFALFLVPCFGCLLNETRTRQFLKCFTTIWTLFYTALSLVGINCSLTETTFLSLDGKGRYIGLAANHSLVMFDINCNITATQLMHAIMIALVALSLLKNKGMRVLLILCLPVLGFALVLTGSRNGILSTGLGLAFAAALALQRSFRKRFPDTGTRVLVYGSLLFGVAIVGVLAFSIAQDAMAGLASNTDITLRVRDFFGGGSTFFSGREVVWTACFELLKKRRSIWLFGTSPRRFRKFLRKYTGCRLPHAHNIYLQALMDGGIPGLILFALFLFVLFRAMARLVHKQDSPLWQRFLLLPIVPVLISECVESHMMLNRLTKYGISTLILFMLFSGVTIALGNGPEPSTGSGDDMHSAGDLAKKGRQQASPAI